METPEGGKRFLPNSDDAFTKKPPPAATPRPRRAPANSTAAKKPPAPRTVPAHQGAVRTTGASRQARRTKVNVRTRNGGGFNPSVNPSINVSIGGGKGAGQQADTTATGSRVGAANGTPGAGFMSNEDIHAWCEAVRKQARNKAVERAMDAEQLEAVLERIPTAQGSMAGARMRARRVSRHLRRIARAEKLIARAAAAAYAQFEREFEADLRKVGKARQPQATKFQF